MVAEPLRRPLRDALTAGAGEPAAARVITGVCSSVQSSPPRVVLQLPDGTETAPLPYPAWWAPRAGDVAVCLYQAGSIYIVSVAAPALTVTSPHRHKSTDIDGTTIPAPPAPRPVPVRPPAPPKRRSVNVQPLDMGSWGYPGGRIAEKELRQGGQTHDAFWFYGDRITSAKGGGRIVSGSIYVQRLSAYHGNPRGANVRLGAHNYAARPGAEGGVHSVSVVGQLALGAGRTFALPRSVIDALNSGARGVGLGKGDTSYSSPDYLRAVVGGASGALSLTIEG